MSKHGITDTRTERGRLLAMMPGGIEAQEKIGQREVAQSDQLPRDGLLGRDRAQWESVGVKIPDDALGSDPLFCEVELPAGWKKRPTDHPLHTDLLDQNGRVRGKIFYKAAFYDRHANISMMRRFNVKRNFEREDYQSIIQCQVTDGGRVIFRSVEHWAHDTKQRSDSQNRLAYKLNEVIEEIAILSCLTWLADRGIENSRDPTAYWGVEIAPAEEDDPMPTLRAPAGRLSGHAAIALARSRRSTVLIGMREEDALEVDVDIASSTTFCTYEDIFWIDHPAHPPEGA